MRKLIDDEYAGSYAAAGRVFVLNLIAGVGAVTMIGIVIATLVRWCWQTIVN